MIAKRIFLVASLLIFSGLANSAPLKTVGYALYSELDESLFIAALKETDLEHSKGESSLGKIEKQLEIKFLKSRFATGRFTRLLLHNAAINNSDASIQKNKKHLDAFVELMSHSFYRGDHIVFKTLGDDGFLITLDGVEIGHVKSRELFDILLNGWIGDVPPTRVFKESLLGGGESAMLAKHYPGITYSENRRLAIEDYISAKKSLEDDPPPRLLGEEMTDAPPAGVSSITSPALDDAQD